MKEANASRPLDLLRATPHPSKRTIAFTARISPIHGETAMLHALWRTPTT
jgi:hypothetical protein